MGRVLVTGGLGFIGSHTVDRLIDSGYDVRVMDAMDRRVHPDGRMPDWKNPRAEYRYGDVRCRDDWQELLEEVSHVIHLAAYQDYQTDFSRFFETNSAGTVLLYETIVARKLPVKKVVIASSQAVYGEGAYNCPKHGTVCPTPRPEAHLQFWNWNCYCPVCSQSVRWAWQQEETVSPHNAYALSKYHQEQIGLTLGRRYGIPTTALRYSIVQGPRQSLYNAYSGMLRRFTLQLLHDEPVTIYEDGRQLRDYVAVQDVVDANLLALEDSRTHYEVYNVGGDRAVAVMDYLRTLAEKLVPGKDPRVRLGGYRFGDARHSVSDVSRLKRLGWSPRVSLDEMLDGYLEWAKTQPVASMSTVQADQAMEAAGVVCWRPER